MASVLQTIAGLDAQAQADLLANCAAQPHLGDEMLATVRGELLDRCRQDGWFWLTFVKTRDEASEESVKPFPRHRPDLCRPAPLQCLACKLQVLWRHFERDQKIVIAKSRQMMVSWIVAAFCVWLARFQDHRAIYWQTQKEEDACAIVANAEGKAPSRMQIIERYLPAWLQQPVVPRDGILTYPNGSFIQALAGGKDQVRGKTASLIVEDEFAFQPEARGVYTAVGPLIQKACRFIAVSTPNGSDNIFAELVHGHPMELANV